MALSARELELLAHPPNLSAELRNLVRQIPPGMVTSFGDLAEALGDLQASRWVATELQTLPPDEFPVHRVIRRTGQVVDSPSLSFDRRRELLRSEGIFVRDGVVSDQESVWTGFVGSRPLEELRQLQVRLSRRLRFAPLKRLPKRLAGLDVSYPTEGLGVAALAIVDVGTHSLISHETLVDSSPFPYIPGYLSFRELPLYLKLLRNVEQAGRLEPWILVDGNGILHPRRAGIASLVGLAMSVCTVGVSKHLLCGHVAKSGGEIVSDDGEILGYRLDRGSKSRTLYVSPGAGVEVEGALRLVEAVLTGHRLPEPLYHADRLSRAAARRS